MMMLSKLEATRSNICRRKGCFEVVWGPQGVFPSSALSLFLVAPKSYVMTERVPVNDGVCL